MKKYMKLGLLSLAAAAVLVGCGSDSTSSEGTTLETGYFIDAPVEGLAYETASGIKGTTDQFGRFQYRAGEKVKFMLGKLEMGEAAPDQEGLVTPESLAGADETLKVLLLRVLQALDSDNDPSNGITIPQDVVETLSQLPTEKRITELSDEAQLLELDKNLAEALDEDYDGVIDVDATTAQMHFDNSISRWHSGIKPDQNAGSASAGNGNGNRHGNGNGNGSQNGKGTGMYPDLSGYPLATLTNDQKYALAYMWNEEKLAKDIYLALNELYPANQFYNIATRSETKHEAAVEELVQRYDINITNLQDYTVNYSEEELRALPAGTFGVDKIQELYDALYAKGSQSKVDALQVGCMVEVTDVDDLDKFIASAEEVNATDLVKVFEFLRAGSYNHYWAFDKALKAEGVAAGCASAGAEYAKTPEEYPASH